METIFMKTESSKTNESHKCGHNLKEKLNLRSSNKHIALQKLSLYYTCKNIRRLYGNNRLKIEVLTLCDEFYYLMVLI